MSIIAGNKIENIKSNTEIKPNRSQLNEAKANRVKLVKYKILITRHLRQNARKQQQQQDEHRETEKKKAI